MKIKKPTSVGVKLSASMLDELDKLADAHGTSRSEIVRNCISIGLPLLQSGRSIDFARALTILEHTQLALSMLVERQYPDDAGPLLDMAFKNVEEFHG